MRPRLSAPNRNPPALNTALGEFSKLYPYREFCRKYEICRVISETPEESLEQFEVRGTWEEWFWRTLEFGSILRIIGEIRGV